MNFNWAVRGAAVAALVEFGLLRVVLRLGPALPWTPATAVFFDGAVLVGSVALNVAVILGAIAVALWLREKIGTDSGPRTWVVAMTAASLVGGTLAAPAELAALWPTGLAIVALLGGLEGRSGVAVLPAAAYSTVAAHWVIGSKAGTGLLSGLAEVGVVGLGLWFFFSNLPAQNPQRLAGGLLVGLALTAALTFTGWLIKAVGIWTVGITFFLPAPIYGLALSGLLWQLLADRRSIRGAGLLLTLGGLRVDVSYFALLHLTGLLGWQSRKPQVSPDRSKVPGPIISG